MAGPDEIANGMGPHGCLVQSEMLPIWLLKLSPLEPEPITSGLPCG